MILSRTQVMNKRDWTLGSQALSFQFGLTLALTTILPFLPWRYHLCGISVGTASKKHRKSTPSISTGHKENSSVGSVLVEQVWVPGFEP